MRAFQIQTMGTHNICCICLYVIQLHSSKQIFGWARALFSAKQKLWQKPPKKVEELYDDERQTYACEPVSSDSV